MRKISNRIATMVSPRLRSDKARFVIFFNIILIIITAGASCTAPSTQSPGNVPSIESRDSKLVVGIRSTVPPVKDFCEAFKEILANELLGQGVRVEQKEILNQYKGAAFLRYGGLLTPPPSSPLQVEDADARRYEEQRVDIECGPNSLASGQLLIPTENKQYPSDQYLKKITFSKPFYETGIRLLLNKKLAQYLAASQSESELRSRLKRIKIGVLQDTTTASQLKAKDTIYSAEIVEAEYKPDPNPGKLGTNSLEKALTLLVGGQIEALASDAPIIQTLFQDGLGVFGTEGTINYLSQRIPFQNLKNPEFAIFPSKDFKPEFITDTDEYLPELQLEQYVIAIRKEDATYDVASLELLINNLLSNNLNEPNSKLGSAREEIKRFEQGNRTSFFSFPFLLLGFFAFCLLLVPFLKLVFPQRRDAPVISPPPEPPPPELPKPLPPDLSDPPEVPPPPEIPNPPVYESQTSKSSRELLQSQRRRLERQCAVVQSNWDDVHDRWKQLRDVLYTETSTIQKIQLERQIQDAETQLQQLDTQLTDLENQIDNIDQQLQDL